MIAMLFGSIDRCIYMSCTLLINTQKIYALMYCKGKKNYAWYRIEALNHKDLGSTLTRTRQGYNGCTSSIKKYKSV